MRKFAGFLLFAAVLAGLPGLSMDRALAQTYPTYRVIVTGTFASGGTLSGSFLVTANPAYFVSDPHDGLTGYSDKAISMLSITADGVTYTAANIVDDLPPAGILAAVYFSQALSTGSTPLIWMELLSGSNGVEIGSCCPISNQLATNSALPTDLGTYSATVSAYLVPFSQFNASLQAGLDSKKPALDTFAFESSFTLPSGGSINPSSPAGTVTLAIGSYSVTFPAFSAGPSGSYYYDGTVNGVKLAAAFVPAGNLSYRFVAGGLGANLNGLPPSVPVSLTVGTDNGMANVKPTIIHY